MHQGEKKHNVHLPLCPAMTTRTAASSRPWRWRRELQPPPGHGYGDEFDQEMGWRRLDLEMAWSRRGLAREGIGRMGE